MTGFSEAREQFDVFYSIVESAFDRIAKAKGLICMEVAIVASYDDVTKTATVYFPSDMSVESNLYQNKTGEPLTVGSKVYIFHKYGDTEQGWIMAK